MLKHAQCFFLLGSCGPRNDISFFGPRLKKFADPCSRLSLWEYDQTRSVLPSGEWLLPPSDHLQNRILYVKFA